MKGKKREGNLIPTFPAMRSFLENWGLDDDFLASFWNGKNSPAVNISETDETMVVEVAVPGMEKEDFNISIDKGQLSVSAEKEETSEEKEKNYHRKEYSFQSFERSFWLPDNISEEGVEATYDKGVLKITLQKEPVEESKKIEIKVD